MRKILLLVALSAVVLSSWADARSRRSSANADSPGALSLDIEGVLFLQDNEFNNPLAKGMTMPGFRLRPVLAYKPTSNIKIEGGLSMLHYWGASLYPEGCYLGVPVYDADENSKRLHMVPFLRAEMKVDNWKFVLGNIYGAMAHRLPLPLYMPSNRFTADPEAGAQVLFNSERFDMDVWVDWRTFIYRASPYQENFYAGFSSRLKYDVPNTTWHLYMPIQALAEHRGGEIDASNNSIMTHVNANLGFGAIYDMEGPINKFSFEVNGMRSWQQKGNSWPYRHGWAWWTTAALKVYNVNFTLGHFYAHRFCNIMSSPVFGVASAKYIGSVVKNPHTLYMAFDYSHEFAKGYSLGVRTEMFYICNAKVFDPRVGVYDRKGSPSFMLLAYMNINPSFLLKHFR